MVKSSTKSNELKVSDAADGEGIGLVGEEHAAEGTVEEQVPAVGGIVLRTTPVEGA